MFEIEGNEQVFLTPQHGKIITALVYNETKMSLQEFSKKISMNPALLSRYLGGTIPITKKALDKVLGGLSSTNQGTTTKYTHTWQTTIMIHQCKTGQDAPSADSTPQDET